MKSSHNPKINGFENVLLHIHTIVVVLDTLGHSNKLLKKSPVFFFLFIQRETLFIKAQSPPFLNFEFRRVFKNERSTKLDGIDPFIQIDKKPS